MQASPPFGRFHGHHAVVIGASISGLLAARVLASHFDRVTLFDRDVLPSIVTHRRAVPHGRHGHGLLASGLRGLKRLFPALERELLEGGAVPGDVIGHVRWFYDGLFKAKFVSGLDGLLMTRPLLEVTLRRQVEGLPNVRVVDDSHVLDLLTDGGRVQGLRVKRASQEPQAIAADFVVDASGRASRAPEWLAELKFDTPTVDEVCVDIRYTSRTFQRRPFDLEGDCGSITTAVPPYDTRFGVMLAQEGGRWLVTLGGLLGEQPPSDLEGFIEYARSLANPDIAEVISHAEPIGDASTFVVPSSVRRRYERLTQFPQRFLVIGDAICSFNPSYGQGMSVATLEALALQDCLERAASLDGLWRGFFAAAGRIVDGPWQITVGGDLAFPGVAGYRPAGSSLVAWYMKHVHAAASSDRHVCRTFFDVANMLRPPSALFSPGVMFRVFRESVVMRSPLVIEADRSTTTRRGRMLETH